MLISVVNRPTLGLAVGADMGRVGVEELQTIVEASIALSIVPRVTPFVGGL